MEIVSLQEARTKGLQFYYTGKTCKRGHVNVRYTATQMCATCQKATDKLRYNANLEHRCSSSRKYKSTRKQELSLKSKMWRENNRGKVNEHIAFRRAALLQQTPGWANRETIKEIYEDCTTISLMSRMCGGEGFEVDHVIPLQGETVSGLHVESNLQILCKTENGAKTNKWEE